MFEWLIDNKRECYLCGEHDYLKSYHSDFCGYGGICTKCIKYLELTSKIIREKEERIFAKEQLKKQKKWRKLRDDELEK